MSLAPTTARDAATIGLAALAIGLLAQFLFIDAAFGVNVPIATTALLAAGWLVRDRSRPKPRLVDAWLAPMAIVFSGFVALRGDVTLVDLDMLAALGLAGGALASFGGLSVVERPMAGILALGARLCASGLVGGGRALAGVGRLLPALRRARGGTMVSVVRGILIAAPLVALFVVLFASADAVFARIAGNLLDWRLDLGSLPGRVVMALVVAWLAAGLLAFVAAGKDRDISADATAAWEGRPRLGSGEAVTVLVVLDLLFAAFVALQAAYLFGGRDTLDAGGLTYAEYARRGFFELLAVAFVVGGLMLGLEAFVRSRTRAYLVAAIGLVALTIVVLASALLRLRLYQEAYGWTELRFYVLAAIAWLAIGAVMAIVTLATDRTRWLLHGMIVLSFGFGLGFNLVGPVRFIAEQNIARVVHPELVAPGGFAGLDVSYLATLGDDAVPILAGNLCSLASREASDALRSAKQRLTRDQAGQAWQAWNLSRERARAIEVPEFCLLAAQ